MKKFATQFLLACAFAALIGFAGCWASKYTLAAPSEAKVDHAYLGTWKAANAKGEPGDLLIANIDDKLYYVETHDSGKAYPEGITRYTGFITQFKGRTFAHLRPINDDGSIEDQWLLQRLELSGDKLVITQLNDEFMKSQKIESSKDLQDVIEKHIEDKAMYDDSETITATRVKKSS